MTKPITNHELYRRAAGHTISSLAAAIGFSHSYVSRVEAGKDAPSRDYREKVAQVLHVPEHVIFGEDEPEGVPV